jgi:hypothetical protein
MAITIALALVAVLGLATGALGVAQPTVTAVWPRMGPLGGGTPLTVVGSGFTVGTPSVTIAGIPGGNRPRNGGLEMGSTGIERMSPNLCSCLDDCGGQGEI